MAKNLREGDKTSITWKDHVICPLYVCVFGCFHFCSKYFTSKPRPFTHNHSVTTP